jgi:hypothetical protein
MPQLPSGLDGRFGAFRAAWMLQEDNGYITHKLVVESNWYVFWMFLGGRWEYLPFGTLEADGGLGWEPLIGDVIAVAGAIGRSRVLTLVVEREGRAEEDGAWWWLIYWRRGNQRYLLTV